MNLGAFEIALVTEVKRATGLADGKVIWANQTRDRPLRPFIELAVTDSTVTSTHSETYVQDTVAPTPGNEITLVTRDHVVLGVQLRAFSAEVVGSNKAFNLLDMVRLHFGKESCIEFLAGQSEAISVIERGRIQDATVVLETEHEGRAVSSLRLQVADVSMETTTYIQEAIVETTVEETDGPVTRTLTVTLP